MNKKIHQVLDLIQKIFKNHGIDVFLIADSVLVEDWKKENKLMLGFKFEAFEEYDVDVVNDLIENFGNVECIKKPFDYERAFKFNCDGINVILAGYFLKDEIRYCPFSDVKKNLVFESALLDDMKKKRIGNKFVFVPTPVEEYVESTFNDDGKYIIRNVQ